MTAYNINNYQSTHFQYQTLDKIHGQPTLESILHLFRQLKNNAQSVPTTLGGGQLGFLALVLPDEAYNSIPNSRIFIRPVNPGPFIINNPHRRTTRQSESTPDTDSTISAAIVAQQKADWERQIRLYNECQSVEQALRHQIIEAIEPEYLDALRNEHTEMVQDDIPTIIAHLRKTYGTITDEELLDREDSLKAMVYDPCHSVDSVFSKIQKHQELAVLLNNPLTEKQQVSIAQKIFNRLSLFQNDLIKWNEKSDTDKKLRNFKTHMRNSWDQLKRVGALSMRDSSLQNVNLIKQVTDKQQQLADELRTDLSLQLKNTISDAIMYLHNTDSQSTSEDENLTSTTISTPSANSVTSNITMESLYTTIQNLQNDIKKLKTPKMIRDTDINVKTGKPFKRYCWTHGCCAHFSRNCDSKAIGHIDNTSFKNRQGGSNKNCLGSG